MRTCNASKRAIARWLEKTVKDMYATDSDGCACLFLGEGRQLALAVGWLGGFDTEDDGYHSAKQADYCLSAKIVKYNKSDCSVFEYMDMPCFVRDGECIDTTVTFVKDPDWMNIASWYFSWHRDIVRKMRYGKAA